MARTVRTIIKFGIVSLAAISVGACEIQRAEEASDAQVAMVGMPREQVLACMGAPANRVTVGDTEVWTYNSGNGRTDTLGVANAWGGWGSAVGVGTSTSTSRYCKVSIVMNGDRVTRVNYTGPTGGLFTEGEQCAFAVQNCTQQARTYSAAAARPYMQIPAPPTSSETGPAANNDASAQTAAPEQKACTKQDLEVAQIARQNGYQYHLSCK